MSAIRPNRERYLLSLADELRSQSNRVRDLIGDAHWLSDGHHKEFLLIDLLRRHLPAGMIAARGFVVSASKPNAVSKEQDILILDAGDEAPVFNQGGLVITFPNIVRAAISVKTRLKNANVNDSIEGLCSLRNTCNGFVDPRSIWCGAYYFDVDPIVSRNPSTVFEYISRSMAANPISPAATPQNHPIPLGPDLHCSAHDFVFKLNHAYKSDDKTTVEARLCGYETKGLATAIFLGELLSHIAVARGSLDVEFGRVVESDSVKLIGDQSAAIQASHIPAPPAGAG
jgi:hypothetical protein